MAAVTHRDATADTAGSTGYNTAAFTPAAGDLLVMFAAASVTVAAGTATANANGITFTRVTTATKAAGADTMYWFVADQLVGASPVSMVATFSCIGDGANGAVVMVASISGMNKTGLTAIRQTAKQDNQAGGTTPAPVFASSCLTGNATLVGLMSTSAAGTTPPTDWTELADISYASPTVGGAYVSRDSGFTGTTITWGSTSTAFGCIAIEIDSTTDLTGTFATTLGDAVLAASGTVANPVEGTFATTLDGAVLAAVGTETLTGTFATTLDDAVLSATGVETLTGTFATVLDDATLAATGTETITGSLATTLDDATLAAAGTETLTGTFAVTLGNAVFAAVGSGGTPARDIFAYAIAVHHRTADAVPANPRAALAMHHRKAEATP